MLDMVAKETMTALEHDLFCANSAPLRSARQKSQCPEPAGAPSAFLGNAIAGPGSADSRALLPCHSQLQGHWRAVIFHMPFFPHKHMKQRWAQVWNSPEQQSPGHGQGPAQPISIPERAVGKQEAQECAECLNNLSCPQCPQSPEPSKG
ncbi:hypothetical protein IHE44_0004516 [Lamprotornis superbus]|uniref:Uncharacterized protein n=1 Tax=Lamprotornis superbus TaxID=245042 RepID=A0A835NYV4_9PASS|nr:hypothetical protein IHE44_0004516 [Lamprotornis superbus]